MRLRNDKRSNANSRKAVAALVILVHVAGPMTALAQDKSVLTLDAYIDQVEAQNDQFKSADRSEKANTLRADEYRLMTSPQFFGNYSTTIDKRETAAPAFQGTETDAQTAAFGIQQKTRYGLDAKLSYNWNSTELKGVSPSIVPVPAFATAGPVLELNQSLWKNGFGSETRANQDAAQAGTLAQRFGSTFSKFQIRMQAESAYWRLAVAREAVLATQESLNRTNRSRQWVADRAKYELADRADLLQQDAASAAREMELQKAKDEERAAARAFNTARNIESLEVTEGLSPISEDLIKSLAVPQRQGARADVRAKEQESIASRAKAKAGEEGMKPTVDVFATVGLNGRDPATSPALSESLTTNYPNYTVGVKFNVALEQGIQARAREGYRAEAEANEMIFRRKVYETEREWTDLEQKFAEGKNRLTIASKLEKAQKSKLDNERERLRRGRTTTFQVIQFEEDFANAQLNRIRMEAEVLGIYSQMKTFGGAQ